MVSSGTLLTQMVTGSCRSLLDGRRQPGSFSRFENVWPSAPSSSQRQGGSHLERLAGDAPASAQRFKRVQRPRRRRRCGSHIKRRLKQLDAIEGTTKQPKHNHNTASGNREDRPHQSLRRHKHHVLHTGQETGATNDSRLAQMGLIESY